MATEARIPESFLRGLEADLRSLCMDARRKNPNVKDAAERVILALKEADTTELKMVAVDSAAVAFCAACEAPPSPSSSLSTYVKVVVRAVSSLHKLLTHRAVSSARLPEVLSALHRLAVNCIDDTITLKVLQGLLSLLTVRSYSKSLSEDELSRAFSLLFVLKTSRPSNSGNPASNALSAISSAAGGAGGSGSTANLPSDLGVIEQTSKAAFRQASSDLFASAADAAVQTAVRMQVPSGEVIPLQDFPTEARASYRFFMDLCHAMSGESLSWLSRVHHHQQQPLSIDLALALEVIDDGLSSSVSLFAAQPVFLDILSKTLCPVIHHLLTSQLDKTSTKSLFGLIVTVVTHYWRNLPVESQDLLHALVRICLTNIKQSSATESTSWPTVFAMEAIRCIFRSQLADASAIVDFVREFELADWCTSPVSAIVVVASDAMHSSTSLVDNKSSLPTPPISDTLKPFAKTILISSSFLASVSTGVYVQIVKAAEFAVEKDAKDVARVLMDIESTKKAVQFIGKLIESHPFSNTPITPRLGDTNIPEPISVLAKCLSAVTLVSHSCNLEANRTAAFSTLCSACAMTIRNHGESNVAVTDYSKRVSIIYNVLFDLVSKCQESLGRSWISAVEAFEMLDTWIHKVDQAGEKNSPVLKRATDSLKQKLSDIFVCTEYLKWPACHDMISALVQCSRQSMASLSRRSGTEELPIKADISKGNLRVFGISTAETAMLHALRRTFNSTDPMPPTLWELIAGHLTSVCSDSSLYALRLFALNSLTRIACEAIVRTDVTAIAHEKIVTPFLDLFNSSHADVRSGSLSSLYTILETQGELLKGEGAWRVVLSILTTAAGSKASAKVKDHGTAKWSTDRSNVAQRTATSTGGSNGRTAGSSATTGTVVPVVSQGDEMISEGFKVVQVLADDFLSSLARNSLPAWLKVLGLYCRQEHNINVALTSIGLLWRTADFLAKEKDDAIMDDWLWVEVFQILKQVSMDERPEIRNCAVKTLTGALTTHSTQLSAGAWCGCAERALLPLLEEVMVGGLTSANSSTATATAVNPASTSSGDLDDYSSTLDESLAFSSVTNATRAGSGGGRNDSQVMWHHSRDTPRKQWNETRVLALSGVAKVLRSAMPRLAVLTDESGNPLFLTLTDGGSNGLWRKMLRAAGVAAASRDEEVAIAGASALLEMLGAAGFVVGRNEIDSAQANQPGKENGQCVDGHHPDFSSSSSAPASLGSGISTGKTTTSVASSMSWVAGVISGATSIRSEQNYEAIQDVVEKLPVLEVNENGAPNQERTLESNQIKQATKGTITLWEAVWSALVEAICGVDANTGASADIAETKELHGKNREGEKIDANHFQNDGIDTDSSHDGQLKQVNTGVANSSTTKSDMHHEMSRIVDEKALQMLAEGLIESRSKLADKFTSRSSRMLLQVLMFLAAGSPNAIATASNSINKNNGINETDQQQYQRNKAGPKSNMSASLTDVQEVTLSGLKSLSFGDDVDSWTGLLNGLLMIIRTALRNRHRNRHNRQSSPQYVKYVILTRRILDIVRTLYGRQDVPGSVKTGLLKRLIPVLGCIIHSRTDIDRFMSRFVTRVDVLNHHRRDATTCKSILSAEANVGNNKPRANEKDEDEADEWTLWIVGCDTLLIAMRHSFEVPNIFLDEEANQSTSESQADGKVPLSGSPRSDGVVVNNKTELISSSSSSSTPRQDLSEEWSICADVIDQFLFGNEEINTSANSSSYSTNQSISTATYVIQTNSKMAFLEQERAQCEVYDIKVVSCLARGIEQMKASHHNHLNRNMIESTSRKLIHIVARGAAEGELMGRRKFVRICQACLFTLSQQQPQGHVPTPDLVQAECGRSVVDTCAGVLAKYIADGARAGKCPLPASRRSEAVFLLRQLRQMARNGDDKPSKKKNTRSRGEGEGRKRVLALYPRLCECTESGDETIRLLARDLLDETSPKMERDTASNSACTTITTSNIAGALLLPAAFAHKT